jgi:hypothetical protein
MEIYDRGPRRASRKRRRKKLSEKEQKKRRTSKAAPHPKRPKRPKRPKAKPKAAPRKVVPRKAKPKAAPHPKRPKRPEAKPKAAPRPKRPKHPKRPKKITHAILARENRRLRKEIAGLVPAEQAARGTPKRGQQKAAIRRRKRELARERAEQIFLGREPREEISDKKKRALREADWERRRKRFRELFRRAEKAGQLRKRTRTPRRVISRENVGEQRMIRIDRILTSDLVADVLYQVDRAMRTMTGSYDLWLAKIVFASLGDRLFGSGNRLLSTSPDDPDEAWFTAQGFDSTGAWNSYAGMRERLEDVLDDYAATPRNIVLIQDVKLMNFSKRGDGT